MELRRSASPDASLGCSSSSDRAGGNFSQDAEHVYQSGSDREFTTVGQLVGTSDIVVYGTVADVEAGTTRSYDDGSDTESTTRLLVVNVTKTLFPRTDVKDAGQFGVSDGYWEGHVGYESETLPWAKPGNTGYFFLEKADDPQAKVPYHDLVSEAGRVLVTSDKVFYAEGSLWSSGAAANPGQLDSSVTEGVRDALSGKAKPVTATVCRPSVPGDENSKPICSQEK
jgi:hypothetical protein